MYLFLTNRAKFLNLRMKSVASSVTMLCDEISKTEPTPETMELKKTAHELAKNLRLFNYTNDCLQTCYQSSFDYFSSFFFPSTPQYKLRVKTGEYLSNAEFEFDKFIELADSCDNFKLVR